MPFTSLQVKCEFKGCIIPHGPVLRRDPELPQWVSDIYWQLKNRRIQLFPLLCLGAVEDTGGRVSLLMCSNSFLAKPTQSKVSDARKVLFSSRAWSYPLWINTILKPEKTKLSRQFKSGFIFQSFILNMQNQYSGYNSYSSSYLPLGTPVDCVSDHLLVEQKLVSFIMLQKIR